MTKINHILSVDQFSSDQLAAIIEQTQQMENIFQAAQTHYHPLHGKILCNLFYEPSTRTSSSFYAAMVKLGGSVIPINEVSYSSVAKGETLEDTIRTMSQYCDAIVLRHPEQGTASIAASVSPVPIINAGDGIGEHPTQALLDLYTIIRELKKDVEHVTLMGDLLNGRTVHSLVKLLRIYYPSIRFAFIGPSTLQIPQSYIGPNDYVSDNIEDVIHFTDVVYVTRVQRERLPKDFHISQYVLTAEILDQAHHYAIVMHPFPRTGEIPTILDSNHRCVYFKQIRYGLYTRMSLLVASILRSTTIF